MKSVILLQIPTTLLAMVGIQSVVFWRRLLIQTNTLHSVIFDTALAPNDFQSTINTILGPLKAFNAIANGLADVRASNSNYHSRCPLCVMITPSSSFEGPYKLCGLCMMVCISLTFQLLVLFSSALSSRFVCCSPPFAHPPSSHPIQTLSLQPSSSKHSLIFV
ncbi:uncharacterized protein EDB91DRAFT_858077 [Suillus paluster]|uniref:uncharacterized protein n=1 Tax=Suillus paluster TaxID=48578 RepID=UPI001B880BB9|nr:uncharacterized protein EDB91DRAFT_858077 [Suillus paluster]KAG1728364.1 hypothetical protein EDB91DRAFT_858077 [Suillus paluster]